MIASGALRGRNGGVKLGDLRTLSALYNVHPAHLLPRYDPRLTEMAKVHRSASTKKKSKVVVKKAVDTETMWAAIRFVIVGSVLMAFGIAMAGLGFYSDYFGRQRVKNGTEYTIVMNETIRLQFISLQFIGPAFLSVGAFVLMFACVMTLESRDKHAQVVHKYDQDEKEVKVNLARKLTMRKQKSGTEFGEKRGSSSPNASPADFLDKTKLYNNNVNNNNVGERGFEKRPTPMGSVNRCFVRDDSKATSARLESGSLSPPGTATTHLTVLTMKSDLWGGKYPSTSCIDTLSRKADPRVLLQRFLEDQSRLIQKSMPKQSRSVDVPNLDATYRRKFAAPRRGVKSEESHSGAYSVVTAEVHKENDIESPSVFGSWERRCTNGEGVRGIRGRIGTQSSTDTGDFSLNDLESGSLFNSECSISVERTSDFMTHMTPPIVNPETLEEYSFPVTPMSLTEDGAPRRNLSSRALRHGDIQYRSTDLLSLPGADNETLTNSSGTTVLQPRTKAADYTCSSSSSYLTVQSPMTDLAALNSSNAPAHRSPVLVSTRGPLPVGPWFQAEPQQRSPSAPLPTNTAVQLWLQGTDTNDNLKSFYVDRQLSRSAHDLNRNHNFNTSNC